MDIISYKGIDDLMFTDSLEIIKRKVSQYKGVKQIDKVVMDKVYPSIYVKDINLVIVFNEDVKSVRYFEIEHDVYHQGVNLHSENLIKLKSFYRGLDPDIVIESDGFDSQKFGLSVTKLGSSKKNNVLVYSKDYLDEDEISEDDIIKFYLG
jgi:hypothetical protein